MNGIDEVDNSSAQGSFEVFEQLYRSCHKQVLRYFRRAGCPPEISQDLTQETFLRVYRSLNQFRGDSSRQVWIFEVAKNIFKNWLRDRAALKNAAHEVSLEKILDEGADTPPGFLEEPQSDVLESLVLKEDIKQLEAAIDSLPRTQRAVIRLILLDFRYQEIAVALGISIETVKSHVFQARVGLRAKLMSAERCVSPAPEESCNVQSVQKKPERSLSKQEQEILELYRRYRSMRKVAAEYGCSAMWVSKCLGRIPKEVLAREGVEVRLPGYSGKSEPK